MSRVIVAGLAATALLLAGCGAGQSAHPEPIIKTVTVGVPVTAPCVPATLGPPPVYPDSDEALKAAQDAAARYLLLIAGRPLRIARERELQTAVNGCPKAAPK